MTKPLTKWDKITWATIAFAALVGFLIVLQYWPGEAEGQPPEVSEPNDQEMVYGGDWQNGSDPNEPNEVISVGWLVYEPCTTIIIGEEPSQVILEWETGEMVVTGAYEQGAKIFFEFKLKPIVDDYIRNKIEGKKE